MTLEERRRAVIPRCFGQQVVIPLTSCGEAVAVFHTIPLEADQVVLTGPFIMVTCFAASGLTRRLSISGLA